ncbi:hypothetical protein [Rhodococcus tibetensis]|uniref:DUF4203 domain-containing protein n=1 Tax=Rhodococcus tibetensis TaxID=2965064 RepID=A0ABT1QIK3_9NOCA|nr:hypothetical protein [Rhodococcus sp. FXJ9.536]MCQ4122124.1 hypothetical protein [Rhodococcus sp. FXJ9.536]
MTVRVAHVGMVLGGFVTGVALTSPMPSEYAFMIDSFRHGTLYSSGAAGAILGALVAAVVAASMRTRLGLAISAVSGLALLAIGPVIGSSPVVLYTNGIGVGLLLGGLAGMSCTSDRVRLQTVLAAGVVGGLLLAEPLDQYRPSTAVPSQYADYLPEPPHNTDLLALAVLAVTAIVMVVALQSGDFDGPAEPWARSDFGSGRHRRGSVVGETNRNSPSRRNGVHRGGRGHADGLVHRFVAVVTRSRGARRSTRPGTAAFTLPSSLPSSAPVSATSLAAPAALAIPLTADFGWTAYTPLDGGEPALEPSAWDGISTAAPVVAIVACGVAIAYLQRRPARWCNAEIWHFFGGLFCWRAS